MLDSRSTTFPVEVQAPNAGHCASRCDRGSAVRSLARRVGLRVGAGVAATALAAGLTTAATAQAAVSGLMLASPYTDNYKAGFNSDPSRRELRTWLATRSVSAGGATFTPALPAAGTTTVPAADGLTLRGSDGSAAVLSASTTSSNVSANAFRIDANGDFGLLIQESSVAALKSAPIRETLNLTRSGVVVGSATVDYTYDQAIANAAPGSLEYNGPQGRWYVASAPTRLNWEGSPPAAGADTTAPVLVGVTLPAATTKRAIAVKLNATDNLAVTEARFANEDGAWTAWQPYAIAMPWTLSSGAGSKGVFTQVRDAAHNQSKSIYTRIRCSAPCS